MSYAQPALIQIKVYGEDVSPIGLDIEPILISVRPHMQVVGPEGVNIGPSVIEVSAPVLQYCTGQPWEVTSPELCTCKVTQATSSVVACVSQYPFWPLQGSQMHEPDARSG